MYWRNSAKFNFNPDELNDIDKVAWETALNSTNKDVGVPPTRTPEDLLKEEAGVFVEIWKMYRYKVYKLSGENDIERQRDYLIEKILNGIGLLRQLVAQHNPVIGDIRRAEDIILALNEYPLSFQQFRHIFLHHIVIAMTTKNVFMVSRTEHEKYGDAIFTESEHLDKRQKICRKHKWESHEDLRWHYLRIARHLFMKVGLYEQLVEDMKTHTYHQTHYER